MSLRVSSVINKITLPLNEERQNLCNQYLEYTEIHDILETTVDRYNTLVETIKQRYYESKKQFIYKRYYTIIGLIQTALNEHESIFLCYENDKQNRIYNNNPNMEDTSDLNVSNSHGSILPSNESNCRSTNSSIYRRNEADRQSYKNISIHRKSKFESTDQPPKHLLHGRRRTMATLGTDVTNQKKYLQKLNNNSRTLTSTTDKPSVNNSNMSIKIKNVKKLLRSAKGFFEDDATSDSDPRKIFISKLSTDNVWNELQKMKKHNIQLENIINNRSEQFETLLIDWNNLANTFFLTKYHASKHLLKSFIISNKIVD
ncbi:hypothetical protein SNEBB_000097 [Seison nebaliae]|nr:hypothetical protein SNEBB_000097 [Seison nebaliae]